MELVGVVLTALWAMLPAYVPNNVAVLAGGGKPIDGGRNLGERRVLGDGKTWRGTAVGTAAGTAVAVGLTAVAPTMSDILGTPLPEFPLVAGFALAFGAMLGDIAASFLKRRTGRQRGAAFPGLDQLDFVVGALACVWVLAPAWTEVTFTAPMLVVVLVLTPLLHIVTNVGAYWVGLKDEPW
ncbi:CDP-2,3-bis-(O-geranylgeranyl)-sn-glycerol synthase [Haloarcula onubensis]|uniref:CDP-archaeol synthase n=1 Tax=Haloarcula onubensis TaxID=2950539 RepID=A0ABU2FN12_9EURY|nr:CDP-2,3-bis-(O-geranylgeranyl)-sn-glycerol synthase [Halomicroarcula sp. S3CR25-11]MDS0282128.1 CDP-2,3-bis-(O-geranylgeranyl)-sn-glycerol synthase [Halomicroarcula sp. S3CR25-11]